MFFQDEKVGAAGPCNVAKVKPNLTADMIESTSVDLPHFFMMVLGGAFGKIGTSSVDLAEIEASAAATNIHLTEVISPSDLRGYSAEMSATKTDKIRSLLKRGTLRVLLN